MDLQVKINALVTPLEKPSPAGDTGNEPVFLPAVPERDKTRLFHQRNHRLLVVINTRAPQDTGGRNSVPKPDFTR
jgi:hypothetical protein